MLSKLFASTKTNVWKLLFTFAANKFAEAIKSVAKTLESFSARIDSLAVKNCVYHCSFVL